MHRAVVGGTGRRGREGFGLGRGQVALRIGEELRAAAGAAEVVVGAVVCGVVRGGRRVDGHAADRLDGLAVGMLVSCPTRALQPAVSSSAGSVVRAAQIGPVSSRPWPGMASTTPGTASPTQATQAKLQ